NFARDDLSILWIQPVMRVAQRVNIALRPGDLARRHFEDPGLERRIEIPIRADLDLSIATLLDERWQPPDLEVASDQNQDVGLLKFEDEARFCFHEVRIL